MLEQIMYADSEPAQQTTKERVYRQPEPATTITSSNKEEYCLVTRVLLNIGIFMAHIASFFVSEQERAIIQIEAINMASDEARVYCEERYE